MAMAHTQQLAEFRQWQAMKAANNGIMPLPVQQKAIATENEAQLLYAQGGLFADCDVERSVLNATLNPFAGIASIIPAMRTRDRVVNYKFITALGDGGTTPQDEVCDDPPEIGDASATKVMFELGRYSRSTKTFELDALIERYHSGINEGAFLVGDLQGGINLPDTLGQMRVSNREIFGSAVRMAMAFLGRQFQRWHGLRAWDGDPTDVTQNGTGGGWATTYGLQFWIADDYAAVAKDGVVSGGTRASLNSYVDTATEVVGAETGLTIFERLQEAVNVVKNRRDWMGYNNVQWVFAMQSVTWEELSKNLPCMLASNGCAGATINANTGGVGTYFSTDSAEDLRRRMIVPVSGMNIPVIVDDSIPMTIPNGETKQYKSPIYLIPLVVDNEPVTYWRHKDYRFFGGALSPIPASQYDMLGWSDGGRYHWIVKNDGRCFKVDAKIETGLVFRAPMLAAVINDVIVETATVREFPYMPPTEGA